MSGAEPAPRRAQFRAAPRSGARTARARALAPLASLVLAGLAVLAVGCGGSESGASTRDDRVPVRVQPVERRDLVYTATLSGRLYANAQVEVWPEVAGRLVALHRHEGDAVERGDLLAELDPTDLRLELQRAEAALAQARARRDEARRKETRARELFERNVLSRASLETAGAEAAIAEADLQTARAGRDLARERLAKTRVTAPIAGVLQDRGASVGDIVAPSIGGGGGDSLRASGGGRAPLFSVIQTDPLLLEVNVSERDAPAVRRSDEEVPVRVDALPGEAFSGVVDYVAPSLNPVSFTQLIRLRVPNPDGRLKPGMFARIEAVRDVARDGVVVPADALVDLGDTDGVYVVEDGRARLRAVQIRFVAGNQAAVAEGLSEGERVIVEGKSSVREGTEVRLVGSELGSEPRTGS